MIIQEFERYLVERSLCKFCQLRFVKGLDGSCTKDIKIDIDCLNTSSETYIKNCTDSYEEYIPKKCRTGCCPTCLGLLSKQVRDQLIDGIVNCSNIKKYECSNITIAICLPLILHVQQLSMWYALLDKFGAEKISTEKAPDVPLKEMIKLIISPIICKQLNKQYEQDDGNNGIMVNVILKHVKESEQLVKLQQLHEKAFPRLPNTKKQVVSRGLLDKQYTPNRISADLFKEFFEIPPMILAEEIYAESFKVTGPTIYVAGRYCKLVRELSHTPWIINGKRIMDDSIEEIINRAIAPYFSDQPDKAIFMSSGREDVDVRCLGKGRPFVLEIPNALKTTLVPKEAYLMERDVKESSKISVSNIQMVKRDELVHIKSGEEQKRKFYRALCILTKAEATVELLEKLNVPQGFQIIQKTPIRVLHRRPLHSRPRMIHSLKAYVLKENRKILILDIVSQAGTYIKELVHGEFGRTTPSIASIIEQPIDIMALDVMAIDLEWPKDIDNSKHT